MDLRDLVMSCVFAGLFVIIKGTADSGQCFCQLEGRIDECTCNINTVDHFNNDKLFPRLTSLMHKDYFRFYKVNLNRECPFWADDSKCALRDCHVQSCTEDEVPEGLKDRNYLKTENFSYKYSRATHKETDCDDELGYLNTTISDSAYKDFARWQKHDATQDNYCDIDDELSADVEYVDLLLNPERYTGYKGKSAHRIWRTIYQENCFKPSTTFNTFIDSTTLGDLCLEKRVFYRAVSGLHTSINIHLCYQYLIPEENLLPLSFTTGKSSSRWGPNLTDFVRRFNPETTYGEGPKWLKNLYFLFLLQLRAVVKAGPFLEAEDYYTGNSVEDREVRDAIKDVLEVARSFPEHFNESSMFTGGTTAAKMKEEFRLHFRNISRIMDCVGCEKCKLWGKLQVQGLGTALKILFSGHFDIPLKNNRLLLKKTKFQLQRNEIVALINALGKLSTSIQHLGNFRDMMT